MQDRRGDAATATSSSAGLRTRGGSGDTPATAADADRLAQATVLLEQSKAKNKPQSFELKVWHVTDSWSPLYCLFHFVIEVFWRPARSNRCQTVQNL